MDSPNSAERTQSRDHVDLLELLTVLVRHKNFLFAAILGSATIALVVAVFILPKIYTGTAVLMPPQQDQSTAAALLGQLIGGSGTSAGGIATALGLKNPNDLYVGILKSRTIADRLIERFQLQKLYDEDTLVETREVLEDNTTIIAGKDGLIKIEFDDEDPKRAADIANAYVEELENLTKQLAISEASHRRLYFENQVRRARDGLAEADLSLKKVQESTGLIKLDDQARAIFETVAALRGAIAAKELTLSAMSSFATERNPDYIRERQILIGMKQQLAGLERNNKLGAGDILVPTSKVPEVGLNYLSKYRDVKYYEALYGSLAQQLELAKIDEGKNATIIQFVDRAVAPDKKSKPKRALIVIATTIIAGFLAFFWILFKEARDKLRLQRPEALKRLSDSWRTRQTRS